MKRAKFALVGLVLALAMAGGGVAIAQEKPTTVPASSGQQDGEFTGTEFSDGEFGDRESGDGEQGTAVIFGTPSIGYDQAVKAAEAYVKTGHATSATLEDENGSMVYAIEIGGLDVKVDAMTGSVLRVDNGKAE